MASDTAALVEVTQAARDTEQARLVLVLDVFLASYFPHADSVLVAEAIDTDDDLLTFGDIRSLHRLIQSQAGEIAFFNKAITEAELRGARLMQEAAAGMAETTPTMLVHGRKCNCVTCELNETEADILALDPATIIARATLTETSDDQ